MQSTHLGPKGAFNGVSGPSSVALHLSLFQLNILWAALKDGPGIGVFLNAVRGAFDPSNDTRDGVTAASALLRLPPAVCR